MTTIAEGGDWADKGPSLEEKWLELFGERLDRAQGSQATSSGGLEGVYVDFPRGRRIWYGGTNGWSIQVAGAIGDRR